MKNRAVPKRGTIIDGVHYDFVSDHVELLSWFDQELNTGTDPAKTGIRSRDSVWWRCPKCGYVTHSSPYSKLRKGRVRGCVSCDLHRVIGKGTQQYSFGKAYPDLVKFWDFDKNKDTPFDVSCWSNRRRWFKCRVCGTSHQKVVNTFHKMVGCAKCVHQLRTSFGEQALFYYVQKHFPEATNGRRDIITPLELDVYVPNVLKNSTPVAIEYCGSTWHERIYDKMFRKYDSCKDKGIRLLVVWEKKDTETVPDLSKCSDWYTYNNTTRFLDLMAKSISDVLVELGVQPDVDLERDRNVIIGRMHTYRVFNSVADDPEMAEVWITERNSVDPHTVYRDSHMKFWFRCPKCGCERYVTCASAHQFHGCPNCSYGQHETLQFAEDGKTLIRRWRSSKEAARELRFCYDGILDACKGKNGNLGHVFHGFYWKWASGDPNEEVELSAY